MKPKQTYIPAFAALALVVPAAADVIYSNYQNLSIPANFDGLYLDVNTGNYSTSMAAPQTGWDINPYYGGKVVANSPGFQPVRTTTGNTSAIVNLAGGASVGSGSTYSAFVQGPTGETPGAPGYGTSQMLTTSGGNFTAGTEGYLGFKLYTDATYTVANYGWMRVVFTNNTGDAVIKDWAYDNTGGTAINTGNVLQSAAVNSAQTVTLSSASGSFTLGSAITNTGGNTNSVLKTGTGTTTLAGTNTYSGATTIHQGTLTLAAGGSIANSTTLVVGDAGSSGAVLDLTAKSGYTIASDTTLKGVGTVNVGVGNTLAISGTHAPGNSSGVQSVTGNLSYGTASIFEWELNGNTNSSGDRGAAGGYDAVDVTGSLAIDGTAATGTIFKIVLGSGVTADPFWTNPLVPRTWSDIFSYTSLVGSFNTSNIQVTGSGASAIGGGSFSISGTALTWTPVPEPSTALAGLLLGAGLLRRRR